MCVSWRIWGWSEQAIANCGLCRMRQDNVFRKECNGELTSPGDTSVPTYGSIGRLRVFRSDAVQQVLTA